MIYRSTSVGHHSISVSNHLSLLPNLLHKWVALLPPSSLGEHLEFDLSLLNVHKNALPKHQCDLKLDMISLQDCIFTVHLVVCVQFHASISVSLVIPCLNVNEPWLMINQSPINHEK